MIKKIISIEGMHCAHCASKVENSISALDGITDAKVNLDKMVCVAKVSMEVSDDTLKSAIKEAGFEVTGIETKKSLF